MKWLFLLCQFDAFSLQSSLMCYWESLFFFFILMQSWKSKRLNRFSSRQEKAVQRMLCAGLSHSAGTLEPWQEPTPLSVCFADSSLHVIANTILWDHRQLCWMWYGLLLTRDTDHLKPHRPSDATQTIWRHTDHLKPHRPSNTTDHLTPQELAWPS